MPPPPSPAATADTFAPKLITALREGYSFATFGRDALAGLTVAFVALPLSMAIGIASGASPAQGLVTAIVAGFLISAFGGSRFQVGGPTAAFTVVVFATIQRHGYDGLIIATLIASLILMVVGALRLGTFIKYIPYPVVTGFTAGIAVTIFVSQIKDLLGLDVKLPGEFLPKLAALTTALPSANPIAIAIAALSVATIIGLRIYRPSWPNFLVALVLAAGLASAFQLNVATIGSAFGGVPSGLPWPSLPAFDVAKIRDVLPDSVTIALLAGIESLLSAVIADGMTGRRHRSNIELVAQGAANLGSALFGGLPATGAIARTATNIRAGARTPIAGMLHAAFLLAFVMVLAPVLAYVPLAALAAILAVVAWNISEFAHIRAILVGAALSDRLVLAVTFLLTVLVDLTFAIEVGVAMSALAFMHNMAGSVEIEEQAGETGVHRDASGRRIVVYRINGPFFFGATQKLSGVMQRIGDPPAAYVLDLGAVPLIDSTAVAMLRSFIAKATADNADVALLRASPQLRRTLARFGVDATHVVFADTMESALAAVGDRSLARNGRPLAGAELWPASHRS